MTTIYRGHPHKCAMPQYFNYNPPARQTVEVSGIPGNASVEISVIAMKSSN
jgi:enamine deaminase RidA (YjgF/YER057c/UK114 family)